MKHHYIKKLLILSSVTTSVFAVEDYKLEGIFSTKISSLSALYDHDFREGDIVFFGCNSQWHVVNESRDAKPHKRNIGFLNALQEKKIPCFCLAATPSHYRSHVEYTNENHKIQFTNLMDKEFKLDKNSILSKGVIYKIDCCYPDQQMNAILNLYKKSEKMLNRVFYISDDSYILSYLIDTKIMLPTFVFYIEGETKFSPTPSTCRFILSDEPSVHWAFTEPLEKQVAIVRQNPLVLAQTFTCKSDFYPEFTYKDILSFDLFYEFFPMKGIENPHPLLKTFLLRDCWGMNAVIFARWLVKIYNESIWPELMENLVCIMKKPEANVAYHSLLKGLVQAETPEKMSIYKEQMLRLFSLATSPHLLKSNCHSLNAIDDQERNRAIELAQQSFQNSELKASMTLAVWAILLQKNPHVPFIDLLAQKIPDQISPYDFLKVIKKKIPNALNPEIIEHLFNIFPKLGSDYEKLFDHIGKNKISALGFIDILKVLLDLQQKLQLNSDEMTRLYCQLSSLKLEQTDLLNISNSLNRLYKSIKRDDYYERFVGLPILAGIKNIDEQLSCAETANSIFLLYTDAKNRELYFEDLLDRLSSMPSNEHRQDLKDNLSTFLNEIVFKRKKHNVFLGDFHWYQEAIFSIFKIPHEHRCFFFKLMYSVSQSFKFDVWQQISRLAEDIVTVSPNKFSYILYEAANINDITKLRELMGLSRY